MILEFLFYWRAGVASHATYVLIMSAPTGALLVACSIASPRAWPDVTTFSDHTYVPRSTAVVEAMPLWH